MADTKLSALSLATPVSDDVIYLLDDPAGSPTDKKTTVGSIAALAPQGDAVTTDGLEQFAATTSAELAGVISDETGSGNLVFSTSPTLVTPALGEPTALVGTNISGTAAALTVGATTGGAITSDGLDQFAATTSAELSSVLTDNTGSGSVVYSVSPTITGTPALGTPSSLVGTNITGTAAGLTAGTVTTNADLTGHVTSTGNDAVLGSFTLAQLNTAVSNATMAILGSNTFTATQNFGGNQVEGMKSKIVVATSGTLTAAAHGGNVIVTSGDVVVPLTLGFTCTIIAGGVHKVTFNSLDSADMAAGDVMSVIVQEIGATPKIKASLIAAADLVAFV